MKILVAEDELMTRSTIVGLLRGWGYDVIAVSDGGAALQILLGADPPQLALLDWEMPELTGPEVCELVREVRTNTPPHLIILTGRTGDEELVAGLTAGANDYIRKPFSPMELKARIKVAQSMVELQTFLARRMKEFEDFVDDSPLGIVMVERDGSISFANECAHSIFGYDTGELIGQPIESLVWNSYREQHVGMRNEFFTLPMPRMMTRRRSLFGQRKNGKAIPVAVGLNPIPRQAPERIACTILDLSESKLAEERLEQFYELSVDIFCIVGLDGHLVKVNSSLGRKLGYSYEEVMTRNFFDFFSPLELTRVRAKFKQLDLVHVLTDFRCRLQHKNGTEFWIEWNARAECNAGVVYISGRDVTERMRFEKNSDQ